MDYLTYINSTYPIRRTEQQKEEFREYVKTTTKRLGYKVNVETLKNKHNNIVIGDPTTAKLIVTAHYDTPATSLIPNLMLPRNKALGFLYHFGFPIVLALISVLIAFLIGGLLNLPYEAIIVLYLVIYFASYYLGTRTFINKNNKNDNTSGVATVLNILEHNQGKDIAAILFDNEEKGLLGSKAYNEKYKDELTKKLVLNFDCVGLGDNIIFIVKNDAEKLDEYKIIKENFKEDKVFKVHHFPLKGSSGNSDYKSFKCGVGVMACLKHKSIGFYTSRIHTNKDTLAYPENIEYITKQVTEGINKLS